MSITENRKAHHDYFIEDRYEAGLMLEGWEVKSIRAGRAQISEAYVVLKGGEVFLIGAHITPLISVSSHVVVDPVRTRKLLLNQSEIKRLIGKVERSGFTVVPLDLHFSKSRIKLSIGLAKGKKQHDKRDTEKQRDWVREKAQVMRNKRN
ncbi:MAG: SsrA-binding protein SmpB [Rhodocyclaceae bacterium]|nr:SsrA-binding protein SmpB [Rhodocyclaceae bacterium]